MVKIIPFLARPGEDGFVIFRVEINDAPDAYFWVGEEDGNIRVTGFYGVASYFNHDPEPLVVCSKVEPGVVDEAFERLEGCPKDRIDAMLERFNEAMEEKRADKKAWDDYLAWEEEAIKAVEEAEKTDKGEVMF